MVVGSKMCGTRYQEAAADMGGTLCHTCTIFAIGICAECGNPQCGNCGGYVGKAFLCASCRQTRIADQRAAERRAAKEAERAKKAAVEAEKQLYAARKAWLHRTARILDERTRRTFSYGWAVALKSECSASSSYGNYGMYTHTWWEESQLVLTADGSLVYRKRRKGKQTSLFWGKQWVSPLESTQAPRAPGATQELSAIVAQELSAIAVYIGSHYGISLPAFEPPG
jgi:hypothetical protein